MVKLDAAHARKPDVLSNKGRVALVAILFENTTRYQKGEQQTLYWKMDMKPMFMEKG